VNPTLGGGRRTPTRRSEKKESIQHSLRGKGDKGRSYFLCVIVRRESQKDIKARRPQKGEGLGKEKRRERGLPVSGDVAQGAKKISTSPLWII